METIGLFIVTLPFQLLNSIGYYRLFIKAGKTGWHAFIPVLNSITLNEIIGRHKSEVLLEYLPLVNIYVFIRNVVELLHCFGEQRGIQKTMAIAWGVFYIPIFAHKESTKYLGTYTSLPKPVKPKSVAREWWDSILFAVVAATLIRWLIMEAYTIPTPSMENSLLVGDFLFVSKFHYGTRTPRTPLQIPLTHQKIWFTNIPSYLDWIQLPSVRLPGFTSVKRQDVVVFNVPGMYENNLEEPNRANWTKYPVDLKTPYIKRCVGISGDVLQVKEKQLYINGTPAHNPDEMQYKYRVISKDEINQRNLDKLGLDPEDYNSYGRTAPDQVEYTMLLSDKKAQEVKALPYIKSVEVIQAEHEADPRIFAASKYAPWNGDNFGPLTIPKEGMTININDSTLAIYGSTIRDYDHNQNVKIENGKLSIDGKDVTQYTFKQNYYFMMGDNRDNSLDSRYWGFVPEDHIVGKGFFIWLSIDKYGSFFNKIRWKRFFKIIE